MKAQDIQVGKTYRAKVNNRIVTVRVDRISTVGMRSGGSLRDRATYHVTNLSTGRKTTFRSATKFREEVSPFVPTAKTRAKTQTTPPDKQTADTVEVPTLGDNERSTIESLGQSAKSVTDLASPTNSNGSPSAPPIAKQCMESSSAQPILRDDGKGGLTSKLHQGMKRLDTPPHLIVIARAGTGKTTSLIEGLKVVKGIPTKIIPSPQQRAIWEEMAKSRDAKSICFCAFNKPIATELQSRVPQGCDAMTMHSMGFKVVQKAFGRLQPVTWNVEEIIARLVMKDPRQLRKEDAALLSATKSLVSLCKMNLVGNREIASEYGPAAATLAVTDEELDNLSSYYEIDLNGSRSQVYELVPRVLAECMNPKSSIDFDDMIWLPAILGLPVYKYDLLLVDECVPGWTPIMLDDGRSMTIQEIVESDEEVWVRAYDTKKGIGKNCLVSGKHRILNQKPLVKIKVRHLQRTGTNKKCNFVVCTTDHKVWTINRGWVPAGEIRRGDNVIVETAAITTQKGKITVRGRENLSSLQQGNSRGIGNQGGSPESLRRVRKGNGTGLTLAEKTLLGELGHGWEPAIVRTGDAPQFGRGGKPSHYKIDIANRRLKIAVEVDGESHRNRKEQDKKKQDFLESRGWTVVRVPNRDAIQRTSSVVAHLISLADRVGRENCPRPARVVRVDHVSIRDNYVYDITVEDCHNFYANGILVHNCQDLNRCQQELAKRAGRRLILCGDPKQAIYGFAGADATSMKRMEEDLNSTPQGCVVLPLTVTRRCSRKIVAEARQYVPDFEAHADNGEGLVTSAKYPLQGPKGDKTEIPFDKTYMKEVEEGDFILCRCNAPLVSQCFRFLKIGRKATIQGRDIGQGIIKMIEKFKAHSIPNLVSKVTDWMAKEVEKESAKRNPSDAKIISIQDKADCLICFTEGADNVEQVVRKVEAVFTDDKNAPGVRLSSIHKAKGLEARRVFFLRPSDAPCPHPMARSAWQQDQEYNLCYVAVTRAIEHLVYVS